VLETVGRVGQGRQDREPFGQMLDAFEIGGALYCPPPGLLPQGQRLGRTACLGVVVRNYLGRRRHGLGKPGFEEFGYLLVILLAGALEQRLIGGVLHQGMLKDVGAPGRPPHMHQAKPLAPSSWSSPVHDSRWKDPL
jgi:hypothetical protein